MTRETRGGVCPSLTEVATLLSVQPESLCPCSTNSSSGLCVWLALTRSSYGKQGRDAPASENTTDTLRAQAEGIQAAAGSALVEHSQGRYGRKEEWATPAGQTWRTPLCPTAHIHKRQLSLTMRRIQINSGFISEGLQ